MTFYVQGLDSHEVMPLMQLFKPRAVEKMHKVDAAQGIKVHSDSEQSSKSGRALQSYHDVEKLTHNAEQLIANQIMTSPVITIKSDDTIENAISVFQTHQLRHIPVTSHTGVVQGILSDRDILRHLAGLNKDYTKSTTRLNTQNSVKQLMTIEVLTASMDTDVRYIARLFVEQRVGAMPIVTNAKLSGIITRSDLLTAIMRNFVLELWT